MEVTMWTETTRGQYRRDHLAQASDTTDAGWLLLSFFLPAPSRFGRPRQVNLRMVMNAILYILATGCQWRALPKDFPPRSTVQYYFDLWDYDGTLLRIHDTLYVRCREQVGREASPTAAIIDSQSVKGAEKGGARSTRRATTRVRKSKARSATSSLIHKVC